MSGTFKGLHVKEAYKLPRGAIAGPQNRGRPELLVVGYDRVPFWCSQCKGDADFLMPSRGAHRETPTIDYKDDPLRVPVCETCGRLMNCRVRMWDLEIRMRWESMAARHEMGQDVIASPELLAVHVPTDRTRGVWQ